MDRSCLRDYGLAPHVNTDALGLLEELGRRWCNVAALKFYAARYDPKTVAEQHSDLAVLVRNFLGYLSRLPQVSSALLGDEERGQGVMDLDGRFYRIMGVMALLDGVDAVFQLVSEACEGTVRNGWAQILQENVDDIVFAHARSGSIAVFDAIAEDGYGRIGLGQGVTKDAAYAAAAENFVMRHLPWKAELRPLAEPRKPSGVSSSRPTVHGMSTGRRQWILHEFVELLCLPQDYDWLVARAFTDHSWVEVNYAEVRKANQRDNSLLAHRGRIVMEALTVHERAVSVFSRTLTPLWNECLASPMEKGDWKKLFYELDSAFELLLEIRVHDDPVKAKVAAVQALLGVAWQAHGPRLLKARPQIVDEWLRFYRERYAR